jgi:UPF0755 protein
MKRLIFPLLLLAAAVFGGYYYYTNKPNVPDVLADEYIKIPTGSTMKDLERLLESGGYVLDIESFKSRAASDNFKTARTGRFKIKAGWSNKELVKHLHLGEQAGVKVVLNNERTPEQVAGKIARVLEFDSSAYITAFKDEALLESLGLNKTLLLCYFLPNTYEVYWNTDPKKFLERMSTEFKRFWNENRIEKAKVINMTPEQAVIMGSIVEGETNKQDERPRVAGAYINRYLRNIRLQADPTVQFALMEIENTKSFRRLRYSDYLTPHPYNTYVIDGLPPGPICMPSPSSIEAVLAPEKHNYIYFCAKPDLSGYHNFAETLEQHNVNVKAYQNFLRTR